MVGTKLGTQVGTMRAKRGTFAVLIEKENSENGKNSTGEVAEWLKATVC